MGSAENQTGSGSLLHPNSGNHLLDTKGGDLGVLVILESLGSRTEIFNLERWCLTGLLGTMSLLNHSWFWGCALKISNEFQCCWSFYPRAREPSLQLCAATADKLSLFHCMPQHRPSCSSPLEPARDSRAREVSPTVVGTTARSWLCQSWE